MHTSTVGTLNIANSVTDSICLGMAVVVNIFLRNDIRMKSYDGDI